MSSFPWASAPELIRSELKDQEHLLQWTTSLSTSLSLLLKPTWFIRIKKYLLPWSTGVYFGLTCGLGMEGGDFQFRFFFFFFFLKTWALFRSLSLFCLFVLFHFFSFFYFK
ncbi:hypothetical protein HMI56_005941 [Coelomomyces lativittatus]|nr:hypothetical protein HMI56_005941 [Coelomomyces lativittatus]